jgi:hypothetical protein
MAFLECLQRGQRGIGIPGVIDAAQRLGDGLIPTCMDHDPRAQLRRPMVMIRQGWSMSLFQAKQQWSTMLS